jgi:hypothetical protein
LRDGEGKPSLLRLRKKKSHVLLAEPVAPASLLAHVCVCVCLRENEACAKALFDSLVIMERLAAHHAKIQLAARSQAQAPKNG